MDTVGEFARAPTPRDYQPPSTRSRLRPLCRFEVRQIEPGSPFDEQNEATKGPSETLLLNGLRLIVVIRPSARGGP
jgi:hypothetical protein